jgi:hypothetical protein
MKCDTAGEVREFVLKRITAVMPDIGKKGFIH